MFPFTIFRQQNSLTKLHKSIITTLQNTYAVRICINLFNDVESD